MIFFDEERGNLDEVSSRRGWRYAATNGSVFVALVTLMIAAILALAALLVFSRYIVFWAVVLGEAVWKAL